MDMTTYDDEISQKLDENFGLANRRSFSGVEMMGSERKLHHICWLGSHGHLLKKETLDEILK